MPKLSRRYALYLIGAGAAAAVTPTMTFAENTPVICNWDRAFPPYSMERDGKMTGILIECMDNILGKRMGMTLVHQGYSWTEAQSLVFDGEADCLCTNPTDERQQFLLFADEPVVESLPSIFCAVDNPRFAEIEAIDSVDDLTDFRQVDYLGNGWAKRTFPANLKIEYLANLHAVFEAIAQGQSDIFIGNGLAAMYAIKTLGLKKKIHARELPVGQTSAFNFGIRKDYPDAQDIMDKFSAALDEAQLEKTIRKIILHYL